MKVEIPSAERATPEPPSPTHLPEIYRAEFYLPARDGQDPPWKNAV